MTIHVANAPCSWGVLEFGVPTQAPAAQVLDEMAAAGYVGTELGDWGFLPTTPDALASAVAVRRLALVGAFVPVALARAEAFDEGLARAVRTARLLAEATGSPKGLPHDENRDDPGSPQGLPHDENRDDPGSPQGLPHDENRDDPGSPQGLRHDENRHRAPVAQPFRAASNPVVAQPFTAASNPVVAQPFRAASNPVVEQPFRAASNPVVAQPFRAASNPVVAQPFRAASNPVVGQPFRAASPVLVLSDDNATVPNRTARAGRIRDDDGLTPAQWDAFADRAERIARAVLDDTGLRTVFHHHCAGYVETPGEIDALMTRTSASLLGLCLDTGHLTFGGGDPLSAIAAYGERIWHVHFKDCDPAVARAARDHGWDYHAAVRHGIFCELGRGVVPFAAVRDALAARGYDGWIVVEQDVLPGLGTPAESARRNRDFLRTLGL